MGSRAEDPIVVELRETFGDAVDVTPASDQPLLVLLPSVQLGEPWSPAPARALVRFTSWPAQRPEFFIDRNVVNAAGQPPRSSSDQLVLGEAWRQFSYGFPWPAAKPSASAAVLAWLRRFTEDT